jgi:hypothetical protein
MNKLFAGMARVSREDFMKRFDVGVPMDVTTKGNEDVLILYGDTKSLPHPSAKIGIPKLHHEQATEHCNNLKIILTGADQTQQCLAIVGQLESYHIQRFMRLDENKRRVGEDLPLRFVSRIHSHDGKMWERPQMLRTNLWDTMLVSYLSSLKSVLDELRPIAERVARNNTIVIMVCNHGQSDLLINFACSAQTRGLDLSQVLVFATDLPTKAIAEGLRMTVFYDETNYADIPEKSALEFGDHTFSRIMLAKLYCVHMISVLGYDLLFQDVDIVWYRNPLDYFANTNKEFDIVFQQDGSALRFFAPYSANTGCYFVRYNQLTEFFIHSLLVQGNLILQSGSHQTALTTVMSEHASWRGLRVKVLSAETTEEFPGGYHYHRRPQFMKKMMEGKVKPYIFHMSWTINKSNKKNFLEQMGEWHVKDECVGSTADQIQSANSVDFKKACCLAEPIVKCHYRDKPSKIPCKDSPPLDNGGLSFW